MCLQPRNVDLWAVYAEEGVYVYEMVEAMERILGLKAFLVEFKSHCTTPPILHASRESRQIGLEHYTLGPGRDLKISVGGMGISISIPPRIYFNWSVDTICPMMTSEGEESMPSEIAARLPMLSRIALSTLEAYEGMGKSLNFKSFPISEVIIYWTPPTVEKWRLSSFDTREALDINLIPLADYFFDSAYFEARKELLKAKDHLEDIFKGKLPRIKYDGSVANSKDGRLQIINLMILDATFHRPQCREDLKFLTF